MHDGENHFQPAFGVKEPFSIVLVVKATQLKNHQEQMCTQDREAFTPASLPLPHSCLGLLSSPFQFLIWSLFSPPFSIWAVLFSKMKFLQFRRSDTFPCKKGFMEQNDKLMKCKWGDADKTITLISTEKKMTFLCVLFDYTLLVHAKPIFHYQLWHCINSETQWVRKAKIHALPSPLVPPPHSPFLTFCFFSL